LLKFQQFYIVVVAGRGILRVGSRRCGFRVRVSFFTSRVEADNYVSIGSGSVIHAMSEVCVG
jgi:hypothetical protein